MQILESGMIFGNYKPEQVFWIENSQMHNDIGSGVKCVEFILLRGMDKIFFIEAKSSSPKSDTSWDRYQEFLDEIKDKFIHSFNVFCAWYTGRLIDEGEIGTELSAVAYPDAKFVFILIIRGHKKEWLLPLQEELNQKLRHHKAIWRSNVIVMNDEIARKNQLIV